MQGGKDAQDAWNWSLSAKKQLIIWLLCGKWPIKIRHHMHLCHLISTSQHIHAQTRCWIYVHKFSHVSFMGAALKPSLPHISNPKPTWICVFPKYSVSQNSNMWTSGVINGTNWTKSLPTSFTNSKSIFGCVVLQNGMHAHTHRHSRTRTRTYARTSARTRTYSHLLKLY